MKDEQKEILLKAGVDVAGVMHRLGDNEQFLDMCLNTFLEDTTMNALNIAYKSESWNDVFAAAHAMKGIAGNMGFIGLAKVISELVECVRGGGHEGADELIRRSNEQYDKIVRSTHDYFAAAGK